MPDEVVQHACLYGKSSRSQVMQTCHTQQQRKHDYLHEYAARAYRAELDPAMKDGLPVRQLIPSEFEISNFNLGSEITRLEISPQQVLRRGVSVERRQQDYDQPDGNRDQRKDGSLYKLALCVLRASRYACYDCADERA